MTMWLTRLKNLCILLMFSRLDVDYTHISKNKHNIYSTLSDDSKKYMYLYNVQLV